MRRHIWFGSPWQEQLLGDVADDINSGRWSPEVAGSRFGGRHQKHLGQATNSTTFRHPHPSSTAASSSRPQPSCHLRVSRSATIASPWSSLIPIGHQCHVWSSCCIPGLGCSSWCGCLRERARAWMEADTPVPRSPGGGMRRRGTCASEARHVTHLLPGTTPEPAADFPDEPAWSCKQVLQLFSCVMPSFWMWGRRRGCRMSRQMPSS